MATLKSAKAKALVYSIPIPITVALIASGGKANSLSIIGLMLTTAFLWSVYYLHNKRHWHVLSADIMLAVLYVAVAYVLAKIVHINFVAIVSLYIAGWLTLMAKINNLKPVTLSRKRAATNPWIKATMVFVIAFVLFTLKQYLAAFVVTFPYNGVFAVYENSGILQSLSAVFTRNSIALCSFFIADYAVGLHADKWLALVASWAVFGVVLVGVSKLPLLKSIS